MSTQSTQSTTSTLTDLAALASELAAAKATENAATAARIAVETRIVALVAPRDKGTTSIKTGGMTISVVTGYSYKVEKAELANIAAWDTRFVTTKLELNTKAYEDAREHDPAAYAIAARYVTVTPRKPAVTIKLS
jgi:hypothetical protein